MPFAWYFLSILLQPGHLTTVFVKICIHKDSNKCLTHGQARDIHDLSRRQRDEIVFTCNHLLPKVIACKNFFMPGWIKLHRTMTDWEWYDDDTVKTVFLHLLLTVNYEDKYWRGKFVKRGSRITSLSHLAAEIRLSVQQLRTCLNKLESTGELTRESTNEFTHITLIKWDKYQSEDEESTSELTNEQQTNNKRSTNDQQQLKKEKKYKKEKKEEGEVALRAPTPAETARDFFSPEGDKSELIALFVSKGIPEGIVKQEMQKFVLYWTEPNKRGTKTRWEMQNTFEIKRRLVTWFSKIGQSYSAPRETKGITI